MHGHRRSDCRRPPPPPPPPPPGRRRRPAAAGLLRHVGAVRLRMDGFLALSDDDFDWAMQMNFFTTLRATRAALAADG